MKSYKSNGGGERNCFSQTQTHTAVHPALFRFSLFFQRREKEGGETARWLSTVEAAATPGIVRMSFDHLSSEIPPLD